MTPFSATRYGGRTTREDTLKARVEEVWATVRTSLQADSGDGRLVDIGEGVFRVLLQRACAGGPITRVAPQ
ncbi:MAG: NifU family protein [Desulfobacterales bacterium]